MRRILTALAAGLLSVGAFVALAQTTPIRDWLGSETLRITLGSGSGVNITLSGIRNTMGLSPVGAGTTVNVSPTGDVGYILSQGSITTLNVTLPNPADKGQLFYVANGSTADITTLGVNVAPSGATQTQTMSPTTFRQSISPFSPVGWIYDYSSSVWRRIQ